MLMKHNPLKLTTVLILGLGIVSVGSWLTSGRLFPNTPEAQATLTIDALPSAGDFNELNDIFTNLRRNGASLGETSAAVADWMDVHEWRGLTVGQLAELWNMLHDDLVTTRTECSARWTGFLTAPLTDTYIFSNIFHATADVTLRVWVDGQLVLQPAPVEKIAASGSTLSEVPDANDPDAEGDRQSTIALQAGQTVPITVELSVFTPHVRRNWGYPMAMLFWEGENLPRNLVPGTVYSPPEGFNASRIGLKAELFDGPDLKRLVQTRLDTNIDLALVNSPFAPVHGDAQREIIEELWPKLLAADFAGTVDDHFNSPPRVLHRVASGLSSDRKRQVLDMMNAQPQAVAALDSSLMLAVHSAAKHAPGPGMVDFVATWCEGNWSKCELGALDGDNADSFYKRNHHAYYILGRWMNKEFPSRLADLEDRCLVLEDGSCCPGVSMVLTFGYRESYRTDDWLAHLDEVLADETLTGDARATWLTARGFAAENRGGRTEPVEAVPWLNDAMAEVESDDLRCTIVRQLVARLGSMDHGEHAKAIIDSIGAQVASQEEATHWRSEIDRLATYYEQKQIIAVRKADEAYHAELQRRLERAQTNSDQESIEQLQRVLDGLQQP